MPNTDRHPWINFVFNEPSHILNQLFFTKIFPCLKVHLRLEFISPEVESPSFETDQVAISRQRITPLSRISTSICLGFEDEVKSDYRTAKSRSADCLKHLSLSLVVNVTQYCLQISNLFFFSKHFIKNVLREPGLELKDRTTKRGNANPLAKKKCLSNSTTIYHAVQTVRHNSARDTSIN